MNRINWFELSYTYESNLQYVEGEIKLTDQDTYTFTIQEKRRTDSIEDWITEYDVFIGSGISTLRRGSVKTIEEGKIYCEDYMKPFLEQTFLRLFKLLVAGDNK